MSTEIVSVCRFTDCRRPASHPGQSRCEEHRIRFVPDVPAEPQRPEWVRRAEAHALPTRITGGSAA